MAIKGNGVAESWMIKEMVSGVHSVKGLGRVLVRGRRKKRLVREGRMVKTGW